MRRGLSLAFYANGLAMVLFFTAVMVPRWRVALQGDGRHGARLWNRSPDHEEVGITGREEESWKHPCPQLHFSVLST